MRKFDKDRFWNCLRIFSKRRGGNLAKTSFQIVLESLRRGDEEYWQRQVLKLSWNVLEEEMRNFGKDRFWNCLRMFSKRRWGNLAKTSFQIVLERLRRGDEEYWQRQVLKLSWNVLEEEMRNFGTDKFWNCLRSFSKRSWGNLAKTGFEIVLEYSRRGDEEIWQRHVLKLS